MKKVSLSLWEQNTLLTYAKGERADAINTLCYFYRTINFVKKELRDFFKNRHCPALKGDKEMIRFWVLRLREFRFKFSFLKKELLKRS